MLQCKQTEALDIRIIHTISHTIKNISSTASSAAEEMFFHLVYFPDLFFPLAQIK